MKRYLAIILSISFLISCQKNSNEYLVTGTIQGVPDGKKVTLKSVIENRPVEIAADTLINGKFEFKGSVSEPNIHVILIQGVQGRLPFILENAELDITLYKDSLDLSLIKGGKENHVAQKYVNDVSKFKKRNDSLMINFNKARQNNDTAFIKTFREKRQAINDENYKYNKEFLKNNSSSLFSVFLLENMSASGAMPVNETKEFYDSFPDNLKNSKAGIRIKERIDAVLATEIGAIAPDFTAPDPDGNQITLSGVRGKVTILDFWAAWCAPCRRENPNLVKIYETYHDRGLEIMGVSLDGNPRQKDAKQAWIDAIEKDNLTWPQVSNLNYFNDPVAKTYNIRAIPAMFVLDEDGKIIAKNLRGSALQEKISELLE